MRVQIFVDDESEPRATLDPPAPFDLDTVGLADGPHVLRVRAADERGPAGVHEIPFTVRNGPGITVFGLSDREVVRGRVPILVNAYSARPGEAFEPVRAETPTPIPTWAWVLCLVVATWALYYGATEYQEYGARLRAAAPSASARAPAAAADREAPQPATGGADGALGAQVFGNYCAACHQITGTGVPGVFPALSGNSVVLADDAAEHVNTILYGLQGKVIDGVAYASAMPPFGGQLSDEQIAAVVNHERTSWGNDARRIGPGDVAALR